MAWFLSEPPEGVVGQLTPACPTTRTNALVEKYMEGRAPGILTFSVKGANGSGKWKPAARFQDALKLMVRLVEHR